MISTRGAILLCILYIELALALEDEYEEVREMLFSKSKRPTALTLL